MTIPESDLHLVPPSARVYAEVFHDFQKAMVDHDFDFMHSLLSEDCQWETAPASLGRPSLDRDGVKEKLSDLFGEGFDKGKVKVCTSLRSSIAKELIRYAVRLGEGV